MKTKREPMPRMKLQCNLCNKIFTRAKLFKKEIKCPKCHEHDVEIIG